MKYRVLGKHGPCVSAIGLGRGSHPVEYGDPLEEEFAATVQRALDVGINFFDTSDSYWWGRHEVLLGRALRGRRAEALVATKFGNIDSPDRKAVDGRPEYAYQCCDASLKRLGVDHIDVYYLHRVDPQVPIEETVGAMARLVELGKVRWIGLCEAGPATIRRAAAVHPLAALQTEYSLWSRHCESELLPVCRELGVAYVAYAPLGRGLLTGRIKHCDDLGANDRRRTHPRFAAENLPRNVALVEELEVMAAAKQVSAAQLALAWLLAQSDDVVLIPGTNHVCHVEANAAAVDVELSAAERNRLNDVFTPGAGAGERSRPGALKGMGI